MSETTCLCLYTDYSNCEMQSATDYIFKWQYWLPKRTQLWPCFYTELNVLYKGLWTAQFISLKATGMHFTSTIFYRQSNHDRYHAAYLFSFLWCVHDELAWQSPKFVNSNTAHVKYELFIACNLHARTGPQNCAACNRYCIGNFTIDAWRNFDRLSVIALNIICILSKFHHTSIVNNCRVRVPSSRWRSLSAALHQ